MNGGDVALASLEKRRLRPEDTRRLVVFGVVAAFGAAIFAVGLAVAGRAGVVFPVLSSAAILVGTAALLGGVLAAASVVVLNLVAGLVELAAAVKAKKAGVPAAPAGLDIRVRRFAPLVVLALALLAVFGFGGLISACIVSSSADARAFTEQRFAAVRRHPRTYIDPHHDGAEKAAYEAIAASTDQRLDPFAGSTGHGDNPFQLEFTQSCLQGELLLRTGASRDIAMLVIGGRKGGRMEHQFAEIALDRRCSCVSHEKNGRETCTLVP